MPGTREVPNASGSGSALQPPQGWKSASLWRWRESRLQELWGPEKYTGSEETESRSKDLQIFLMPQGQYPSTVHFPRTEPRLWALRHHSVFLQRHRLRCSQVKAELALLTSSGFPLSSLGSLLSLPSKDRWGKWALFKGDQSTPHYRQMNKQSLSCLSPLLQNKVAFKRKNSLRFCVLNREKVPGAQTRNIEWPILRHGSHQR